MSCRYKYNNKWYSKDEITNILLEKNNINSKGELIKPAISNNNPKQSRVTKENTISIESVKIKLIGGLKYKGLDLDTLEEIYEKVPASEKEKEYTSQSLINLKVAALKEVARKYPRSLITSKVVPINPNMVDNSEIQYSKISPSESNDSIAINNTLIQSISDQQQENSIPFIVSQLESTIENTLSNTVDEFELLDQINTLEEKNKIEKECFTTPRAHNGMLFSNNNTGDWEIYKDLEGVGKTHRQGGIDISIEGGKVLFKSNLSKIHAANGMVIPSDEVN